MRNDTTPIYGVIQAMTSVGSGARRARVAEPRAVNPPRPSGFRAERAPEGRADR